MDVRSNKTQKPSTDTSTSSSSSSSSSKDIHAQEKRIENKEPVDENYSNDEEMVDEEEEEVHDATLVEPVEKEEKDDDGHDEDGANTIPTKKFKRNHRQHLNAPNTEGKISRTLWTRENEIKLLNLLVKFKRKNSSVKGANEYLKKKFKDAFTGQQIEYKIKRIRKKYKLYKSKVGSLDSYQKELYDLCELIWNENVGKEDIKEERIPFDLDCYVDDVLKDYGGELDKKIIRDGFDVMEASKKQVLKEKWFELRKAELEISSRRSALLAEHLRYSREAYESIP